MQQILVGRFRDPKDAEVALRLLVADGIPQDSIELKAHGLGSRSFLRDDAASTGLLQGLGNFFDRLFSAVGKGDAAVIANLGTITAFATGDDRPTLPFWPMLLENLSLRLVGSDDFTPAQREAAVADLTAAAAEGWLRPRIAEPVPLECCAEAHDRVAAGSRERQLLRVTEG